ncbi:hypothetical protein [Nocardia tengchongensis]|uniref:hypothetical protein n=1 Tax=Nocardia tengchongensis TaxID=2055889 RepID=UPI0036BD2D1C
MNGSATAAGTWTDSGGQDLRVDDRYAGLLSISKNTIDSNTRGYARDPWRGKDV